MPKVVPEYRALAKARIARAAWEVFSTKGFRRATMDDVARKLGVSKGVLYLYFSSKVELLAEIQRHGRREARAGMAGVLRERDPAEGLANLVDQMITEMLPEGGWVMWFELLAEASTNAAVREVLVEDQQEDLKMMREFLLQLSRKGQVAKGKDLDALAWVVISLTQGAAIRLSFGEDRATVRTSLRDGIRLALRA